MAGMGTLLSTARSILKPRQTEQECQEVPLRNLADLLPKP